MTRTLLFLFILTVHHSLLLADGYPFDPETQHVRLPTVRLKLSAEQVRKVSATGTLTFSDEHLRWLRCFYPAATHRTEVIAATFNDNHEGLGPEDVYCFWVASDEVAITLNEKHPKDKSPFVLPDRSFPTDDELKEDTTRHLRLSPDGKIYHRGKAISLEQAFATINDLARLPKRQIGGDDRALFIMVPPPLAGHDLPDPDPNGRLTSHQIFQALASYGISKAIQVSRSW